MSFNHLRVQNQCNFRLYRVEIVSLSTYKRTQEEECASSPKTHKRVGKILCKQCFVSNYKKRRKKKQLLIWSGRISRQRSKAKDVEHMKCVLRRVWKWCLENFGSRKSLMRSRKPLWKRFVFTCLFSLGVSVSDFKTGSWWVSDFTVRHHLKTINYYLTFLPNQSVCIFSLVFNRSAAMRRLHFSRQTALKPGCWVMQFKTAPSGMSCRTISLHMASLQPSNSWQQ